MRRSILALILLVSACAPRPQPVAQQPAPQPAPQPRAGQLLGFTAAQLIAQLGAPALQVREGSSLKLQFRSASCVLDTYLYPTTAGGAPKVTYVDARLPSGADTDQAACISALGGRS
jgi:hypothetical protein